MTRVSCAALIAAMVGSTAQALAQVPPGFEVVILSESSGIHSVPDINNSCAVTFSVESFTTTQMYLFEDGVVREITGNQSYAVFPAINDAGTIAFMTSAVFSGPYNPARYLDGNVLQIADNMQLGSLMDINNSGIITWTHAFSPNAIPAEIFSYDSGSIAQLSSNGLSNQNAHINSCGMVVYAAIDFMQSPDVSTIFLYYDGSTTALTDKQSLRLDTDINDSDQIVWRERYPGGIDFIILWESGAMTTIASGNSSNAVGSPRLSGLGHVMFNRWNDKISKWDVWLWTPASLFQIPDFGTSSAQGDMNDHDEGVWRALGPNGTTAVLLLRRVGAQGDFNRDCHRDLHDLAIMQNCLSGSTVALPLSAECSRADLDGDLDLDNEDLIAFISLMTGPDDYISGCVP